MTPRNRDFTMCLWYISIELRGAGSLQPSGGWSPALYSVSISSGPRSLSHNFLEQVTSTHPDKIDQYILGDCVPTIPCSPHHVVWLPSSSDVRRLLSQPRQTSSLRRSAAKSDECLAWATLRIASSRTDRLATAALWRATLTRQLLLHQLSSNGGSDDKLWPGSAGESSDRQWLEVSERTLTSLPLRVAFYRTSSPSSLSRSRLTSP